MRVLFLAPQPYYQDRGTPIAIDKLLQVLSERREQVDVVAYHEGKAVSYDNVTLYRTLNLPFVRDIRPGFSWKKIVCDVLMVFKVLSLIRRNRYDLVHAVEESVFIALLLKWMLGVPYVYDMDSSLSEQMIESKPKLKPLARLFSIAEGIAIRRARAVMPVCAALAVSAERHDPAMVTIVPDVSLLDDGPVEPREDLRAALGIAGPLLLYVGNLEVYQGIDLLLDSFAIARRAAPADLVIIGGKDADIQKYRDKSAALGISDYVHFVGPRPIEDLKAYLVQADMLVSPRIKGNNTPMKVYSYLDSGKALLATNLHTHTQVLTDDVALLAPPEAEAFARSMARLIADADLRKRLGLAGKHLLDDKYTFLAFRERVNGFYNWLHSEIVDGAPKTRSYAHDLHRWLVEHQEWQVQYQPIVSLQTGNITGFEALVRWRHPKRRAVSPTEFIPIAEATGLILPLGRRVLNEACRQMRLWQAKYPGVEPLTICVNLSSRQFAQPDFVDQITQILQKTDLDPRSLRLELAESDLLHQLDYAANTLARLKALGVQLHIDDVGAHGAILDQLHRLPVDTLKLDRDVVIKLGTADEPTANLERLMRLAHEHGIRVIAEGVETIRQLGRLRALNFDAAQGYIFSQPLDGAAVEAMLAAPDWQTQPQYDLGERSVGDPLLYNAASAI